MIEPGTDPSLHAGYGGRQRRPPEPSRRRIWPWILGALLAAFVAGIAGSPWLREGLGRYVPALAEEAAAPAADGRVEGLELRLAQLEGGRGGKAEQPPEQQPAAGRIAALEAQAATRRVEKSDILGQLQRLETEIGRTRALAENPDLGARDLFLLAVSRRMVEAGRPLGPVAPLLQARFQASDGRAVEALLAWSGEPQTRRTLAARMPELARSDVPAGKPAATGWWEQLKAGFSGLVKVHPPEDAARNERAGAVTAASVALAQGDLGQAIAGVEKLRPTAATSRWLHEARQLRDAEAALDTLDGLVLSQAIATLTREAPAQKPPAPADARAGG